MFIDINKISVLLNIYICLSWASSGARGSTYQTGKQIHAIVKNDAFFFYFNNIVCLNGGKEITR